MTYLEAREIVDEIIDDKRDVEVEGKMGVVIDYLLEQKRINDNKHNDRMERFDRLSKINAPDIILQNEVRMSGEHEGRAYAYDDAAKIIKILNALPENIGAKIILETVYDSKHRGCRDCRYRFSNYKGGYDFDSHFYCGMHVEMEEEEKEMLRRGMTEIMKDGSIKECTPEEIEAHIAEGRSVLGEGGFNKPCKHYSPSPSPLWDFTKKEVEYVKKFIKEDIPNLEDEGWNENKVLVHMIFCKRNEGRFDNATKKLLKAIFGEDEEEESNEDNA